MDDVPGAERQREIRRATDRCRRLATTITCLQAELVEATRALVDLEGSLGGITAATHLAAECQLTGAEARRAVGLATKLRTLPGIADAFTQGLLSEGTTVTLASVATPDNEAVLLETAANANASQLQKLVSSFRQKKDDDDVEARRPVDERLSYGVRGDGMWHISGRAHPERGAQIEAAFRAIGEGDEELRSEAEVHRMEREPDDDRHVVVEGVGVIGDADDGEGDDRRSRPKRDRPDQRDVRPPGAMERLVRMAQSIIAGTTTAAGVVPDRFLTVIHLDERDVEAGRVHAPIHVQGGGPVDGAALDELLCGSSVSYVIERHGQPVTVTLPQRDPSLAMRIALFARDRGCRFCGSANYLHPHHIRHVGRRGRTRLSNLILLCGPCHRRLHQHGWTIVGDPNGRRDAIEFRRADGSRIPVTLLRRHPPPPEPDDPTTGPSDEPDAPPPADGDEPPHRSEPAGTEPAGTEPAGTQPGSGDPDHEAVAFRRPHNDQRLSHYARDVVISHWLESTRAAGAAK